MRVGLDGYPLCGPLTGVGHYTLELSRALALNNAADQFELIAPFDFHPAVAAQLARETIIGSAELLAQSKDSPEELRRKVTTPKGTTQAAIETLQAGDFAGLMKKAIQAAAARSKELGR